MAATENKLGAPDAGWLPRICIRIAGALPGLMALVVAPAYAVDWRFEPNVGGIATYTDNVGQRSTNKQDALILGITPGFSLNSIGSRRVQASLQYGLSGVTRFGGDSKNDIYHRLNAAGKAELVEDFLFIEGRANVSQELISLLGSNANATTNDSNRTTVGTYLLSPYIKKRLGSFATSELRYTASGALFQNNVATNSNVNAISANLTSGPRFNDVNWALDYSLRKAENQKFGNTTFERVNARLGYGVTRKLRVFGTVGQDSNDYLSSTSTSGSSYSVGFDWEPTRRTSLQASVGERYFGPTFSLMGSHRTRLSRWTIRYAEDVSDITQQFLEQSNQLFFLCAAAPVIQPAVDALQPPPTGCQGPYTAGQLINAGRNLSDADLVALGLKTVATAQGVYILKSLTAGVSWDIGRLGLGFSAQDTKRLYQVLGDAQDRIQGITASASYRLTPKTIANSTLALSRNSFDPILAGGLTGGLPREDDILTLSLGLNHRFAEDLSGALIFRHTTRDSNAANASYDENSISATAAMRF